MLMSAALLAIDLVAGTAISLQAQTSGTWAPTGSMKNDREGHTATLLPNGQVLVAGGFDGTNYLTSAELYNPTTGRWNTTGSMQTARDGHTAVLLSNGQVLVAGGVNTSPNGSFNYLSSAELYNPATGMWTVTGSMTTARQAHTATLLSNGQVLVAGGLTFINNSPVIFSSAELYDPATGTWAKTGSMSVEREQHTATPLPTGEALVAGGFRFDKSMNDSLASDELYNLQQGRFSATGSLNTPRYGHQAVLLGSGNVLVLDGVNQSSGGTFNLNSVELYDTAARTWTVNGNTFKFGASGFNATLLGTGRVLLAGGIVGVYPNEHITNAAESYDSSAGVSASTGSMNTARRGHTATLLSNGKVLVAGGVSMSSKRTLTIVNSAELYTP
jgi:N-acetylneuraminic acid mutarotase